MSEANTVAKPATQTITIQKADWVVPAPFIAGHAINAAEAQTLNQVLGENIRNNVASRIKASMEAAAKATPPRAFSLDTEMVADTREGAAEGSTVTLRQSLQHYADTYAFGIRTARKPSEPADPVEREAFRIARETVNTALAERGQKVKDLPEGKYDEAVALYAKSDKVVKEAKRRVSEKEKIGKDVGGDLLAELGLGAEPAGDDSGEGAEGSEAGEESTAEESEGSEG